MRNEKIIAGFELIIMVVYIFAFSYGISAIDGTFKQLKNQYEKTEKQSQTNLKSTNIAVSILSFISSQINKPMIPVVSADSLDLGCCSVAGNGEKCATTSQGACSGEFSLGTLCKDTSFCQKGCCFDSNTGVYNENVLKSDCQTSWTADPNCNMPQAESGCCVLGDNSFFNTEAQCRVRTKTFSQSDNPNVNWTTGLSELQCIILSQNHNLGACVLDGGDCNLVTLSKCENIGGQFNKGYLCTAEALNTSCKMTTQTKCIAGKNGVYFVDSCGNDANIYNSEKAKDQSYWNKIILPKDSCRDGSAGANANSTSCGNCNRFLGSICDSATKNNFKVDMGDSYCKDISCTFDGVKYKNGESWCVYDGKIGDGDDVVGSRHWKYMCTQGRVDPEPCIDYRNQICVQSNTKSQTGEVVFRNAACVANNWRECILLNYGDDVASKCKEALNCRVQHVDVTSNPIVFPFTDDELKNITTNITPTGTDYFKFDICTPEYPGGFSFTKQRYQTSAKTICGVATQTCKVVYAPKTWGGCNLVANGACLTQKFATQMNDLCRKLGDCGAEVNILGEYTKNYEVENSPDFNQSYINMLKELSNPVPGQFAKVGDYSKYLAAAGIWGGPENTPNASINSSNHMRNVMIGVGAIGYAAGVYATGGSFELTGLISKSVNFGSGGGASVSGFAGASICAAIGYFAGAWLAKSMGLSPGGSQLMAIGGALVGVGAYMIWVASASVVPVLGWIIAIIGVILMIIASFFGGDDCNPIEVKFTCKPWQPPFGGDNCEKCNDNPMKPCSEYRCHSLGAACGIVNKGTKQEMCISSHDDGVPITIKPQNNTISPGQKYSDITPDGFRITSADGGCLDANTQIKFGIITDKLSYCKFDIKSTDFKKMQSDFGGNSFTNNHTIFYRLPDPSHGQSQGSNWTGDLTLYTRCVDVFGHETQKFYKINMCVKQGPDMMPPVIVKVIPDNNGIISFDGTSKNITVITNELSTCSWDKSDKDYFSMNNSMTCTDTINKPSRVSGYVCTAIVPVDASSNTYYIRCADQPWLNDTSKRNANKQSFVYKLRKPNKKITIDWIKPNKNFEVITDMTTIKLQVHTSGGGSYHRCSFSFSGYKNMIKILETGETKIHTQTLNRPAGTNKIYIKCNDETGDYAENSTSFKIIRDTSMPQITRILQLNGRLSIFTLKDAECRYSTTNCQFNWDNGESAGTGTDHTINAVRGTTYYIRCSDALGNAPSGCSISTKVL